MTLGELIAAVDDECVTPQERAAVLVDLLESRMVWSSPPGLEEVGERMPVEEAV